MPERKSDAIDRIVDFIREVILRDRDLERRLELTTSDPAEQRLVSVINDLIAAFQKSLLQLDEEISRSSNLGAVNIVNLSRIAEAVKSQGDQVERLSQMAGQMADAVKEVASSATQSAETAFKLNSAVTSGLEVIGNAISAIQGVKGMADRATGGVQGLARRTSEIDDIIDVISSVARQTQLLSINASIEAAHAGDRGRGFAVVASEVRNLADRTARSTKEISGLVEDIKRRMSDTEKTVSDMAEGVSDGAGKALQAKDAISSIGTLSKAATAMADNIASVAEEQSAAVSALVEGAREIADTVRRAGRSVEEARDLKISGVIESAQAIIGSYKIGSRFDKIKAMLAECARRTEQIVEGLVRDGVLSMSDLWDTNYVEVKGDLIANLASLFDVSRVPREGFSPPKYTTRYDRKVDKPLMDLVEEYMQKNPDFTYVSIEDLNGYGFVVPKKLVQPWTGDPQRDFANNRIKRMYDDPAGLRAARMGLKGAEHVRPRASRSEFLAAGVDLSQPKGERPFLLMTYARDTGEVLKDLGMPLYIGGQRWATLRVGYTPGL
ncbi:MAG: methyl-accepting chemotaxis protein [Firmicutes bacterium]|nr:methyl-accepting chemotaxis protein [Bacillota bacterium]